MMLILFCICYYSSYCIFSAAFIIIDRLLLSLISHYWWIFISHADITPPISWHIFCRFHYVYFAMPFSLPLSTFSFSSSPHFISLFFIISLFAYRCPFLLFSLLATISLHYIPHVSFWWLLYCLLLIFQAFFLYFIIIIIIDIIPTCHIIPLLHLCHASSAPYQSQNGSSFMPSLSSLGFFSPIMV